MSVHNGTGIEKFLFPCELFWATAFLELTFYRENQATSSFNKASIDVYLTSQFYKEMFKQIFF